MDNSKELLREYLNDARDAVLYKAQGLSEQAARTPLTPTGTHVLGVVHHLAITEYGYFGPCLGRQVDNPYVQELLEIDDPQADFLPPAHLSANDIIDLYRQAVDYCEAGIDSLPLDAPAEVPWWNRRRHTTLEQLMIHMIAETSRHAGHLDIVREQLDGFTGLRAQSPNLPPYSQDQWAAQYAALSQIAKQSAAPADQGQGNISS
ncbi:DinB family protein [Glutamicibacter sp. JC586]|uniref:DinB family protein n=1 Tax=Glutamicibacter sp. JC586 TaxID=2590552 RepID=UPI00135C842C|nr:DinB family protein [Glutamicibacter sp. JC586]